MLNVGSIRRDELRRGSSGRPTNPQPLFSLDYIRRTKLDIAPSPTFTSLSLLASRAFSSRSDDGTGLAHLGSSQIGSSVHARQVERHSVSTQHGERCRSQYGSWVRAHSWRGNLSCVVDGGSTCCLFVTRLVCSSANTVSDGLLRQGFLWIDADSCAQIHADVM